jgi:O-antigen biosynthesis protein
VVYHEHRGTIGKKFSSEYIQGVLKKNYLLYTWKNIHEWPRLWEHFFFAWAGALISWIAGDGPGGDSQRTTLTGIARAMMQLPGAVRSRLRARELAAISDTDALRRHQGGYFRDAFGRSYSEQADSEQAYSGQAQSEKDSFLEQDGPLRVLFVAPYPICPPTHGGGVFMYQTVRELARRTELHAIVVLDQDSQRAAHAELDRMCASTAYIVREGGVARMPGTIVPHAVLEFKRADLRWMIHRRIYTHNIDVVQLEYTHLGQYAEEFRRIVNILFEHDVYFQSVGRRIPFLKAGRQRISARWEYLRALRYELRMLPRLDRIQVCSQNGAAYLESFLPELKGRIDADYRAGIDTSQYEFPGDQREPMTMLFLGSFRHLPNQESLEWFAAQVLPLILSEEPRARLVVVGSDPPAQSMFPGNAAIDFVGFVEDVRDALNRYAMFVCPILSGSGVRVKLLEAFAAGIPVVSTRLGAEGLTDGDGEICALADTPEEFARKAVELLRNPEQAAQLAERAHTHVEARHNIRVMTEGLVECYRSEVVRKQKNHEERGAAVS